jgi:hypothetical protein
MFFSIITLAEEETEGMQKALVPGRNPPGTGKMNTWRREETIRENQYLPGITFMRVHRIPAIPSAAAPDQ